MDRYAIPLRLAGALLIAAPSPLLAVTPAAQSSAGALVLRPLSLIKKKDLDFGTLAASTVAGTATVDPATGAVSVTGGVTALSTPASSAAVFVGAGSRNSPYQIRIPNAAITLTRSGGTETMTVSNWTLDGPTNRKVDINEAFEFNVGARLAVAANQVPGTYVGTFAVTVHYP